MHSSSKLRYNLLEFIGSLEKIELYCKDFVNADYFYHDQKSFDASMMQFVVIGEIIFRLDTEYKVKHPHIPWQKIKDFRNIIAHGYFGIDADEVWDIIQNKPLPLRKEIQQLL